MHSDPQAQPQPAAKTGCCGPEHLGAAWQPLVMEVVAAVRTAGRQVVVGDAPRGLDALVRAAAPAAQVFPTELWSHAGLVEAASASGAGAALVGFATIACPALLQPTVDAHTCFSQRVPAPIRHTWGPLAYAAGLKLPVLVFWCGDAAVRLPAWPGGAWVPARASGLWARAWRFAAAEQATLLDDQAAPLDPAAPAPGSPGWDDAQVVRRGRRPRR